MYLNMACRGKTKKCLQVFCLGNPKRRENLGYVHSPRCENNVTVAFTNVIPEDVNSK